MQDCDDLSDEKNCQILNIDPEKYDKTKPPIAITNQNLSITVR